MNAKRALFIKTKNLGDAVILTAAIRAASNEYTVDVLCFDDCAELYLGIPQVDRIWTVARGQRGFTTIRDGLRLVVGLRSRRFDLLCQFSDDWRGALISRILKTKISVAPQSSKRPGLWRRSFKLLANRSNFRRHSADLDVDILRRANVFQGETPRYIAPNRENVNSEIEEYFSLGNITSKNYIVLHLTSRWSFKELGLETNRDLVRGLVRMGFRIILTGQMEDTPKLKIICESLDPRSISLCTNRSLIFFSELLRNAAAVVSVDSLAIHLASAHETPVVAIFGPSGELNWRPWKTHHKIVDQSDLYPCRPCGLDGCGGGKRASVY